MADIPVVFLRGRQCWVRVPQLHGRGPRRAFGTTDMRRARHYCTMLGQLANNGQWDLLRALGASTLEFAEVFEPWRLNRLDQWLQGRAAAAANADLEPLVATWYAALRGTRPKSADTYLRQVRTLLPEGQPFLLERFRRSVLREWLDTQRPKVRNRYRAAASSFAHYLCERELLDTNVVLTVKPAPPAAVRVRYLSSDDAQRVCAALPAGPIRALHALLVATGGDVGGALQLKLRDVDLEAGEVRIPGTKTYTRDRVRRFLVPWAFDLVREYERTLPPEQVLLFDLLQPPGDTVALARANNHVTKHLQRVCRRLGIHDYATKDHRHTFAVQALRDGYSYAVVAWQLGHGNTALAHKVYGNYVVNTADYVRRDVLRVV